MGQPKKVCTCECHKKETDNFCKNPTPCCELSCEKYIAQNRIDYVKLAEIIERRKNPAKRRG